MRSAIFSSKHRQRSLHQRDGGSAFAISKIVPDVGTHVIRLVQAHCGIRAPRSGERTGRTRGTNSSTSSRPKNRGPRSRADGFLNENIPTKITLAHEREGILLKGKVQSSFGRLP